MLKSKDQIMSASRPSDIFTMDVSVIEQEKDEYLKQFKPTEYNAVRNFVITQRIILLYRQAINELSVGDFSAELVLKLIEKDGESYEFDCHYVYDIKIGKMYVSENNIIFVIDRSKKQYYDNYVSKTRSFPKLDKNVWKTIQYMVPEVSKHFETIDGDFAIIVDKPCKIYPLKEILNYFDGNLKPEYVASMMNRLHNFVCYLELIGMNHNGITVENLFFAPGRIVEEGESYTVDDMRIVGVYGGWFFSTWTNESIKGMPKDVYDVIPNRIKNSGYSSYEVDVLSIRRVARELLGDSSGNNMCDMPNALKEWATSTQVDKNGYEEYCKWEKVNINAFGKRRFVHMDVSID